MVPAEESCKRKSVKLDGQDTSNTPEGETDYICVQRHDIMESTFSGGNKKFSCHI